MTRHEYQQNTGHSQKS